MSYTDGNEQGRLSRAVNEIMGPRKAKGLANELLHGMSPEEFREEADKLADALTATPEMRERLKSQLVEQLKTPVDAPTWGPDWVKRVQRGRARRPGWLFRAARAVLLAPVRLIGRLFGMRPKEAPAEPTKPVFTKEERSDAQVIAQNLERSRQVAQYRGLYGLTAFLALAIAILALFVDYQIINGDIWTRALADEFMVVPDSLKDSVVFKSLQVVFAALAVHFMLKITGAYGRNALISTAFVLTLVMILGLGYLVAYNNMEGGTSTTIERAREDISPRRNAIDELFASLGEPKGAKPAPRAAAPAPKPSDNPGERPLVYASAAPETTEVSLPLPKLSAVSLENAQSWFWLAFASVIFFIVTTVAALYLQIVENNVRNFLISRDYKNRKRQFAQLQLIELAGRQG